MMQFLPFIIFIIVIVVLIAWAGILEDRARARLKKWFDDNNGGGEAQ